MVLFALRHFRLKREKQIHTRKMSDRKAVIKNADMSEEMQQDAVDCATQVGNNKPYVYQVRLVLNPKYTSLNWEYL